MKRAFICFLVLAFLLFLTPPKTLLAGGGGGCGDDSSCNNAMYGIAIVGTLALIILIYQNQKAQEIDQKKKADKKDKESSSIISQKPKPVGSIPSAVVYRW